MSNEELSIIEEINKELKNDEQLEFLKKNKNIIISVITAIVIGIVVYSSWYERKNKNLEDITNALLDIAQNPSGQNALIISKFIEDAPAELRPILTIMRSGKELSVGEFAEENLTPLLDLANRGGVEQVWRDLAMLIYASYPTKPPAELIEMLTPLTAENRPFRFTAMEIIAMIYENEGKHEEALEYFNKILKNPEAPKTLKERTSMLSAYIRETAGLPDEVIDDSVEKTEQ